MRILDFPFSNSRHKDNGHHNTLNPSGIIDDVLAGLRADETQPLALVSRFSLSDQIMTHALVDAGIPFLLYYDENAEHDRSSSIVAITLERYDLKLSGGFGGVTEHTTVVNSKLLSSWSDEARVAYVLDHEVPVDPVDMPGFTGLKIAS